MCAKFVSRIRALLSQNSSPVITITVLYFVEKKGRPRPFRRAMGLWRTWKWPVHFGRIIHHFGSDLQHMTFPWWPIWVRWISVTIYWDSVVAGPAYQFLVLFQYRGAGQYRTTGSIRQTFVLEPADSVAHTCSVPGASLPNSDASAWSVNQLLGYLYLVMTCHSVRNSGSTKREGDPWSQPRPPPLNTWQGRWHQCTIFEW